MTASIQMKMVIVLLVRETVRFVMMRKYVKNVWMDIYCKLLLKQEMTPFMELNVHLVILNVKLAVINMIFVHHVMMNTS